MKQIVYVSALAPGVDASVVPDIVRVAAANNSRMQVSGILLYINGSFLQIIEGEAATLDALYEKICADSRHVKQMKLGDSHIEHRQFPDWSMALADVSSADLDRIVRRNDFFARGHCFTELDESLARSVLAEFRSGMWRMKLH